MSSVRGNIHWVGPLPKACSICSGDLGQVFYDAATRYGWGILCHRCFRAHGYGLGTGRGQKFDTSTGHKLDG